MVGCHVAGACAGVADGLLACGVWPRRGSVAYHYGHGIGLAAIGQGARIAEELSIAEILVLELSAVSVGEALATQRYPNACPEIAARVRERAGIAIITGLKVRLEGAAPQAIAPVVGARVLVVAEHRRADTHASLTVVR